MGASQTYNHGASGSFGAVESKVQGPAGITTALNVYSSETMDKVAGPNTIGMDPSIFQRGALGQPKHQKKRLKKRSLINRKEMQVLDMTA